MSLKNMWESKQKVFVTITGTSTSPYSKKAVHLANRLAISTRTKAIEMFVECNFLSELKLQQWRVENKYPINNYHDGYDQNIVISVLQYDVERLFETYEDFHDFMFQEFLNTSKHDEREDEDPLDKTMEGNKENIKDAEINIVEDNVNSHCSIENRYNYTTSSSSSASSGAWFSRYCITSTILLISMMCIISIYYQIGNASSMLVTSLIDCGSSSAAIVFLITIKMNIALAKLSSNFQNHFFVSEWLSTSSDQSSRVKSLSESLDDNEHDDLEFDEQMYLPSSTGYNNQLNHMHQQRYPQEDYTNTQQQHDPHYDSQQQQMHVDPAFNEIYVIGDLHSDVDCGVYWVKKTGVISSGNLYNIGDEIDWQLAKPHAKLVFMGDYVDKGPHAFQLLHFVKTLTDMFPDNVYAILGNHEIEMLRDRSAKTHKKYYEYAYATAHPNEYLNWIPQYHITDDTRNAMDWIYTTLLEKIYPFGLERAWKVSAVKDDKESILTFIDDENKRETFRLELEKAQFFYMRSVGSNTDLGRWLESRPISLRLGSTLFVHGGINPKILFERSHIQTNDHFFYELDRLNSKFYWHFREGKDMYDLLQSDDGKVILNLVNYRGNHESCAEVYYVTKYLNLEHLAVGHTPKTNVRIDCGGKFLAMDSLLGKWIRAHRNYYCRGIENERVGNFERCKAIGHECKGQIVRLNKVVRMNDGNTEVVWESKVIGQET